MEVGTILSIVIPIMVMAIMFFIMIKYKKSEPLTYVEFFMKDKSGPYIHILGARRVMPDEGDSFDIFQHYLFDYEKLKMIKGESQRGKNLHLQSEFVKRSMAKLSGMTGTKLEFVPAKDGFDDDEDGLLKVYRFEQVQSDTEVFEPIQPNCLVFVDQGDAADHFNLNVYREGVLLATHRMRGISDYFFKTVYLEEKSWVCFLYHKQTATLRSGMAVCIVNYTSGEMIFDGFVKPDKA